MVGFVVVLPKIAQSSYKSPFFFFQELREQVEKLEAELEEYKKGGTTALTPFRGRAQSWRGQINSSFIAKMSLSVLLNWLVTVYFIGEVEQKRRAQSFLSGQEPKAGKLVRSEKSPE